LDDLRGGSELSLFDASTVQAMPRRADGVMQFVELFGVELNGLLRTPAEALRPR
jgi:hypothetical protein